MFFCFRYELKIGLIKKFLNSFNEIRFYKEKKIIIFDLLGSYEK